MRNKFESYLLWPLAKRIQKWIVDLFTARNYIQSSNDIFKHFKSVGSMWAFHIEPIQIFWINVGLAVMPRDWWGGSRRRNLEAYSQSWRWKQASISTETTNFSMRGQTEDRWFHHHLLRLYIGVKSFFKENFEPIFAAIYDLLPSILLSFMYGSTYLCYLEWQIFGMTKCVDKQRTDGCIIIS